MLPAEGGTEAGDPDLTGSTTAGLTTAAAAERLRADGPNAFPDRARVTVARILLGQFASPLVLLLVVASAISVAVGDRVDAGIILVIVVISAGLGFVQEARSASAVQALRARLALRTTVVRDGTPVDVPVRDLVSGDLVVLGAGDVVPADGRLIDVNHLYVDESAMTGESAPVAKAVGGTQDRVFSGTSVVSGTGRAVITATGPRTAYGLIARRLQERPPNNDFERGVRRFGLLIGRVILLLVVGVFGADVALGRPLLDSFLFAVALAVGLTPELLPAIVTVNLSRGARALTARGVLVRRLPAIQNLGSMSVLCTDKTGTLTEGRLALERSVAADGEPAPAAVAAAWLNSHFETGFRNPLDDAILAAASAPGDLDGYAKLAELPFDFQRRCLSVLLRQPAGAPILICKGAPDSVLARATTVRANSTGTAPLDASNRVAVQAQIAAAAGLGQRAIAVATRLDGLGTGLDAAAEQGLLFEGLLLFSDPPKAGVAATLAALRDLEVDLRIVTGDDDLVARAVAQAVGLPVAGVLTGTQIQALSPTAFVAQAQATTIFARVDPDQKLRVIQALQERGEVVGYLGDGINDAPPLHVADVGISVDNATDVARAAADVILLQASLDAIAAGVREGRRTFGNTLKYIRMGTSSNFGNMLSMAGAALILPFLPMLPSQILLNNLIYDASQTAIPADTIDPETERQPARWDIGGIERFMLLFGPISSVFDYLTFGLLLLGLGSTETAFHTGWFIESLATQILVIFVIRTGRVPFWRSRPSPLLVASAVAAVAVAVLLPVSPLGAVLGFTGLPPLFWLVLPGLVAVYLALVEAAKWFLLRRGTLGRDERAAAR
ncbi:MAG TPA: magnesium-translocating P-type ATPase [Candidatus Sulfotelmatobacter sp.]|nr:magnesium-translocating P-type ATPase [Candidatus Sulfotelmatobacter sp.]